MEKDLGLPYTIATLGVLVVSVYASSTCLRANRIDEYLNDPKVQSFERNLEEQGQLVSQLGTTGNKGLERLAELKEDISKQEESEIVKGYLEEVEIAKESYPLNLIGGVIGAGAAVISILVICRGRREFRKESA